MGFSGVIYCEVEAEMYPVKSNNYSIEGKFVDFRQNEN